MGRTLTADGQPRVKWDPKRRVSLYAESEADKLALDRGARVQGVTRAVFLSRLLELYRVTTDVANAGSNTRDVARALLYEAGMTE